MNIKIREAVAQIKAENRAKNIPEAFKDEPLY